MEKTVCVTHAHKTPLQIASVPSAYVTSDSRMMALKVALVWYAANSKRCSYELLYFHVEFCGTIATIRRTQSRQYPILYPLLRQWPIMRLPCDRVSNSIIIFGPLFVWQ